MCRSVAQALEREGNCDATGTEGCGGAQHSVIADPCTRESMHTPREAIVSERRKDAHYDCARG